MRDQDKFNGLREVVIIIVSVQMLTISLAIISH